MTESQLFAIILVSGLLNVVLGSFVFSLVFDLRRVKEYTVLMATYIVKMEEELENGKS